VITLGVNRIWLKHIPNFFFFHDTEILTELERNPEVCIQLQHRSKVFTSDWIKQNKKLVVPSWIEIYNRRNKIAFPDSVSTAINLFSTNFVSDSKVTYYVAGVSLKWKEPSHFWKQLEYASLNSLDEEWYSSRFDRMMENFRTIKAKGIKIVSVNPNSNLNKICRYESIENLYVK
jgi:hypothetical protein